MPSTPPYAKATVTINGGASLDGAQDVASAATIRLRGENTSFWTQQRWEWVDYPEGWATPTGWTLDGSTGLIYSTEVEPDDIVLPANTSLWGVWELRLRVNAGVSDDDATARGLIDDTMTLTMLSPLGQRDLGAREEFQNTTTTTRHKGFRRVLQRNARAVEEAIENVEGGSGLEPTTEVGAAVAYNEDGTPSDKRKKVAHVGSFDLHDYGAVGNGTTDDTAAFLATQLAINPSTDYTVRQGGIILLKERTSYKHNGRLEIIATHRLRGAGGSHHSGQGGSSRIIFGQNSRGIGGQGVWFRNYHGTDKSWADGAAFENLGIYPSPLTETITTLPYGSSVAVSASTLYVQEARREFHFECIKAGTVYKRPWPVWQAAHVYSVGDMVTRPNGHVYQCVAVRTDATTGATFPLAFNGGPDMFYAGELFWDGNVQWEEAGFYDEWGHRDMEPFVDAHDPRIKWTAGQTYPSRSIVWVETTPGNPITTCAFWNLEPTAGVAGVTKPTEGAPGTTVSDGGITWTRIAHSYFWQPSDVAEVLSTSQTYPIVFAGETLTLARDSFAAKVWQVDVSTGPTYVDETNDFNSESNADFLPFPATEAVDDYCAIGFAQKFTRLVFDNLNGTAGVGGTVAWEYWDGTSWEALPALADATSGFTAAAADGRAVTWLLPGDWHPLSINGSELLYYVRARVTGTYSTNPVLDQGFVNEANFTTTFTAGSYTKAQVTQAIEAARVAAGGSTSAQPMADHGGEALTGIIRLRGRVRGSSGLVRVVGGSAVTMLGLTVGNTSAVDGPVLHTRAHPGIRFDMTTELIDVYIEGSEGDHVHCHADGSQPTAGSTHASYFERVTGRAGKSAFFRLRGSDANNMTIITPRVAYAYGSQQKEENTAFSDETLTGCTWIGCFNDNHYGYGAHRPGIPALNEITRVYDMSAWGNPPVFIGGHFEGSRTHMIEGVVIGGSPINKTRRSNFVDLSRGFGITGESDHEEVQYDNSNAALNATFKITSWLGPSGPNAAGKRANSNRRLGVFGHRAHQLSGAYEDQSHELVLSNLIKSPHIATGLAAAWNGWWGQTYAPAVNGSQYTSHAFSGPGAPAWKDNEAAGQFWMSRDGFYVGPFWDPNNIPWTVRWRTVAPVSGTWRVGDGIWHTDAVVGQSMFFYCSAAGAPGTWIYGGKLYTDAQEKFISTELEWSGQVDGDGRSLPVSKPKRFGKRTANATPVTLGTIALAEGLNVITVAVDACKVGDDEVASFILKGMWHRDGSTVLEVRNSVVEGEPTDSDNRTSGASAWLAALTNTGTNVTIDITGQAATDIQWSAFTEPRTQPASEEA